jgi:hypothetical protein
VLRDACCVMRDRCASIPGQEAKTGVLSVAMAPVGRHTNTPRSTACHCNHELDGSARRTSMLIYLGAMIVQYCADYEDFIFGSAERNPTNERGLAAELDSLRQLVELEQFGNWTFAASPHLMKELLAGKPTSIQRKVYAILLKAWQDSKWDEFFGANEEKVWTIDQSLKLLKLEHAADRRHLAEAIVLNASWFVTNDGNIIRRTRWKDQTRNELRPLRVARPSECIEQISVGLFLR